MIFGRAGRRWRLSEEQAEAERCPDRNPQACLRCSSTTSSHAWFVVALPRTEPDPGLYCQNCAEAVGIVDEILQRFGDAEIEIPSEASVEQEDRPTVDHVDARPRAMPRVATAQGL
jgi:hypothetical protein